MARRTAGWRPVEEVVLRGDPRRAERLAAALAMEEREDRLTHGFHTWPAGLHPGAVRILLEDAPPGPVLDPFCGGGTVLVEAMVLGRRALGVDLCPVAVLVARARTWRPAGPEDLASLRRTARAITDRARRARPPADGVPAAVRGWYAPTALAEIAALRSGIRQAPAAVRSPLYACLSSILVKASYRESDTRARRLPRPRPAGTTAVLFHRKVREYARRVEALAEAVPPGTPRARVREGDARRDLPREEVAAAITSPPYPGVYDYLAMQRLRLAWMGREDVLRVRGEIASRRAFRHDRGAAIRHWRRDTHAWMAAVARCVPPEGTLWVVIGDGLVGSRPVDALGPTLEEGARAGWRAIASVSGTRADHARRSRRREHLLLLERRPEPPPPR